MPKVNVTFDAQPFTVPNFVRMVPPTKSVCAPTATEVSPNEITIPLGSLDPVTLDNLCSDFRREVFFKAGKTPPPTVESTPLHTINQSWLTDSLNQAAERIGSQRHAHLTEPQVRQILREIFSE